MSLDNPNNWMRVFEGEFHMAQFGSYRGQIEPVWTPTLIQHTVRINVLSIEGKATWKYAGELAQIVGIEEMEVVRQKILLNRKSLIILPALTVEYRLKFEAAPWHKRIQIQIDAYAL